MKDAFEEPNAPKATESGTGEPPVSETSSEQDTDKAKESASEQKPKKKTAKDGLRRGNQVVSTLRKWMRPDTVSGLALTLFAITAIVALALGVGHYFTADVINRRDTEARDEVMRQVMPADTFEPTEDETLFLALQGGKTIGYAVTASPAGYGGPIQMIVGVDLEFKIIAVSLVSMSETPGYGARAESETWFFEQFSGKVLPLNYGDGALDALSGATVTSDAVIEGVRDAVKRAIDYVTGGDAD